MIQFDFDLFVIGGGSGGVRAARIAASHGARVAIAEEFRMGGTCVIRGCVPKKLLVYASRFASDYEDSIGFDGYSGRNFDWPTLIENKNKEISRLEAAYTGTIERSGVTHFATRAVFEGTNKLRLVGLDKAISADKILIATGTPYFGPTIPVEYAISSNAALVCWIFPRACWSMAAAISPLNLPAYLVVSDRRSRLFAVATRFARVLRGCSGGLCGPSWRTERSPSLAAVR